MKVIVKYKSIDEIEWDTEKECIEHENEIKLVSNIMKQLNPIPDNTKFSNGEGFIQQDKNVVDKVGTELINEIKKVISFKISKNHLGALLDNYKHGNNAFKRAWNRIECIDYLSREWGQPYFALNSEKGIQFCINN
jgi:hypothetical protein